ncbi:MAG TPA: hypothetical protein VKA82_11670 [Rubrobacter sp.]|nr:hypothetical protein [Rubrobacter sp.]
MVHISEGVQRPVVGGQVLLEPPRLGGTRATANLLAVAVEGYHVPGPQLVGVVASLRVACGLTGVLEVASGTFGKVLVVAGDGLGAPLEPPPRRPVAFLEVHRRASGVSLIAQGQDRPVDTLDQLGGSLVALGAAAGDVASRDDLRGGGWFRIAAPGDEEDREGGHDETCRDPPTSSDASDQLPVTHRYKVSEGALGCPDVYCVVG